MIIKITAEGSKHKRKSVQAKQGWPSKKSSHDHSQSKKEKRRDSKGEAGKQRLSEKRRKKLADKQS